MRTLILLLFSSFLASSCIENVAQDKRHLALAAQNSAAKMYHSMRERSDTISHRYISVPINSGEEHLIMPFPSNWVTNNSLDTNIVVQSLQGIKIFNPVSRFYFNYKDEKENEKYLKKGYAVAAVKGIDTILETILMPLAAAENTRLMNRYRPKGMKSVVQTKDSLLTSRFKANTISVDMQAIEWEDDKNIKSILVIEQYVKTYSTYTLWGFMLYAMEAPLAMYEEGKEIFLNSVREVQPCYRNIIAENSREIDMLEMRRRQTARYYTAAEEDKIREEVSAKKQAVVESIEHYIRNRKHQNDLKTNIAMIESCAADHASASKQQSYYPTDDESIYSNGGPNIDYSTKNHWNELEIKD